MSEEVAYQVLRTDKADRQIRDEVLYLRDVSGTSTALALLERVESASGILAAFPFSGVVPRTPALARRGYRMLVVGKYLLFYKVDEAGGRVTVYGFFHQRQDYQAWL